MNNPLWVAWQEERAQLHARYAAAAAALEAWEAHHKRTGEALAATKKTAGQLQADLAAHDKNEPPPELPAKKPKKAKP